MAPGECWADDWRVAARGPRPRASDAAFHGVFILFSAVSVTPSLEDMLQE